MVGNKFCIVEQITIIPIYLYLLYTITIFEFISQISKQKVQGISQFIIYFKQKNIMSKAGSTVEKKINKVQFNAKVTAFILGAFNLLTLILVSIVFISVLSYERQYIAVYTRNIEIVFSAISLAISLFIEIYCVCFIRNQMSKEKEMKENNDLFNYNPQIVKNRISFTFPFISIMFICFLVMIGHEGLRITIYGVDYIFILSILAILLIMVSLLYITVKISTMNFKKKDFSLPQEPTGTNANLMIHY